MSPGADAALTACRLEGEPLQAGQDRGVTRGRDIFTEEDHEVAVIPRQKSVCGEVSRPFGLLFDERQIGLISAREQGECVERAGNPVEALGVIRRSHPLGQRGAAEFENALRFLAIIGSGGTVASQHGQLNLHRLRFPGPPAQEFQIAVGCFGCRDGLGEPHSRVI